MKVILSIKPEYAEKIFSLQKDVEFRKIIFKEDVKTIIVYASAPISKVIGEFDVEDIVCGHIEQLWRHNCLKAGISYKAYKEYFKGKTFAYAIRIRCPRLYHQPLPLSHYGLTHAPQSFIYYDEKPQKNNI